MLVGLVDGGPWGGEVCQGDSYTASPGRLCQGNGGNQWQGTSLASTALQKWRQPPFPLTTCQGSHEGENSDSVDPPPRRPRFESMLPHHACPVTVAPVGKVGKGGGQGPAARRILTTALWPLPAAIINEVLPQSQHSVSPSASSGDVQEPVSGGPPEFTKDLVSVLNTGSARTGPR